MQKKSTWMSNFSLGSLELECRHARCALPSSHQHRQVKGGVSTPQGYVNLASYSGKYTPEQSTVYAREVKAFVRKKFYRHRKPKKTEMTHLERLARAGEARWQGRDRDLQALISQENFPAQRWELECETLLLDEPSPPPEERDDPDEVSWSDQATVTTDDVPKLAELGFMTGGVVLDYHSGLELDEAFILRDAKVGNARMPQNIKAPKPVDQYNRVIQKAGDDEILDVSNSHEVEMRKREELARHDESYAKAKQKWKEIADSENWDSVAADLEVYKYCGTRVDKDPRRNDEYRKQVIDGLGFGEDWEKRAPHLTKEDVELLRDVLLRKAAAFWVEDTPRTTLKYLLHDCIPTGPPARTPPHKLQGEEADWVDSQLQKEVETGQLVRGNSEWGSPPFATKAFAEHRRQRKRRLVVDYRKVNQRIRRAVYHIRSADGVVSQVQGSAGMTFVDACKGFNQIANTARAREVLAILARSGQFLPMCLTFGPCNGPEDFAFATDRVYAPGRDRKQRFCKQWHLYADDITVRTGRVVDGVIFSDEEYDQRVSTAQESFSEERMARSFQELSETFLALGFDPKGLSAEGRLVKTKPSKLQPKPSKPAVQPQTRADTAGEKASAGLTTAGTTNPSPFAHTIVVVQLSVAHPFCYCSILPQDEIATLLLHDESAHFSAGRVVCLILMPRPGADWRRPPGRIPGIPHGGRFGQTSDEGELDGFTRRRSSNDDRSTASRHRDAALWMTRDRENGREGSAGCFCRKNDPDYPIDGSVYAEICENWFREAEEDEILAMMNGTIMGRR